MFLRPNDDWRWVLNEQRIGGVPATSLANRSVAGLKQLAGARTSATDIDRTHDFGFDGFFLDTLDTAGPYVNAWGYYAWVAPEMQKTVKFIHDSYPGKIVFANRGTFSVTLSITVPTYVSNPNASINVNGALSDWAALTSFPVDPQDATASGDVAEWARAWLAHDANNLYLALQNHVSITQLNAAFSVYLDTDNTRSTGFRGEETSRPAGLGEQSLPHQPVLPGRQSLAGWKHRGFLPGRGLAAPGRGALVPLSTAVGCP